MFQRLIRMFRNKKLLSTTRPRTFRPELLVLEGRITPVAVDTIWGGNGVGNGALWSVPANWSNGVPDADDTAIFDAIQGSPMGSTMDMGGIGTYHVGKLIFRNAYASTLTLNTDLYVDVLDMTTAATITRMAGNGGVGVELSITQETASTTRPNASIFGTSKWTQGTISTAGLWIWGEDAHRTTLVIGDNTSTTMDLKCNMTVGEYSTVEWKGGDVTVKGTTITNFGTFLADSSGKTMGNDGNAADKWTFDNHKTLNLGKGKFKNVDQKKTGADAREFKILTASPGTNLFEIVGNYTHDVNGAALSVESGTLLVTGDFTQSAGGVDVASGTSMQVAGIYDFSGGTVDVDGGALSVGTFDQSGGTTTVAGLLSSSNTLSIGGGTLALLGGEIESDVDVDITSGGTLTGFGTVDVSGTLVNAGTISLSNYPGGATLSVLGDYTQTSVGTLDLLLFDPTAYNTLSISGLATFAGSLNLTLMWNEPAVGQWMFEVVTYGSRSGTFDTAALTILSPGDFDYNTQYQYNDSLDSGVLIISVTVTLPPA